ncbi:DNA-processing protein DprA [Polycladidibacter stylochi]|uniref:DNA-processing protein DprA n=1 Tax=Polycladidibacter stylochi TaxID=1807766 RepID=UPI00083781F4|nr:DNA-processing protein DprA [Pseudovibrio stylochi]
MPPNTMATKPSLDEEQRLDWLQLIRSENIGPSTFRDLLNYFGSAKAAISALPELSRKGGKKRYNLCPRHLAESEYQQILKAGGKLIAVGEENYPKKLKHIDTPPPLLTVVQPSTQTKNHIEHETIAIVGARNCSIAGEKIAAKLSNELSEAGFTIVSGLARGIDSAAHKACLPKTTWAVLAGGLQQIYPQENEELARNIYRSGGALFTEMPWNWQPRTHDFPRRNRIISGMCRGVVVIEAATRSGSLHTARFAIEQNREVFAIPGSPLDPRSLGANKLIQSGATLVNTTQDIIDTLEMHQTMNQEKFCDITVEHKSQGMGSDFAASQLSLTLKCNQPKNIAKDKRELLKTALSTTPVYQDDLIDHLDLAPKEIQLFLLELELAGVIQKQSGNRISLVS